MRVTKTHYEFEGSSAEFQEVEHLFAPTQVGASVVSPPNIDASNESTPETVAGADTETPQPELTEDIVEAFFKKRSPTTGQVAVIKAIYKSGDAGTTTKDIATTTGIHQESVKALFRAFGKRVNHMPSWPKNIEMFDRHREGQQNRYRLHKPMRAVIEAGSVGL